MNYQGYLTDAGTTPLDGSFAMTFRLYADSTGGAPLWSESYASVQVVAGVFNVILGRETPLPPAVFDGTTPWLQTTVGAVELLPRRPLVTVAYAFRAAFTDNELWQTDGTHVFRASGNVGVGTATPTEKLQVDGVIHSLSGGIKFPDGTVQTTAAGPAPSIIRSIQSGESVVGTSTNSGVFVVTVAAVDLSKSICIVGGSVVGGGGLDCGCNLTTSTSLQIRWSADGANIPANRHVAWQVVEFN